MQHADPFGTTAEHATNLQPCTHLVKQMHAGEGRATKQQNRTQNMFKVPLDAGINQLNSYVVPLFCPKQEQEQGLALFPQDQPAAANLGTGKKARAALGGKF